MLLPPLDTGERASYARVLNEAGEPTDQIEDKADYHIMDCERYLWSYLGEQRGLGISFVIPPYDPISDLRFDFADTDFRR